MKPDEYKASKKGSREADLEDNIKHREKIHRNKKKYRRNRKYFREDDYIEDETNF